MTFVSTHLQGTSNFPSPPPNETASKICARKLSMVSVLLGHLIHTNGPLQFIAHGHTNTKAFPFHQHLCSHTLTLTTTAKLLASVAYSHQHSHTLTPTLPTLAPSLSQPYTNTLTLTSRFSNYYFQTLAPSLSPPYTYTCLTITPSISSPHSHPHTYTQVPRQQNTYTPIPTQTKALTCSLPHPHTTTQQG